MNSTSTTELFPFMQKAQVSAGKLASKSRRACPEPCRRAQPPRKWSFRVDLPLVRESMQDVNGSPVRARSPEDIANLCADIRQSAQEAFIVIDLNAKNNVIDKRLVTLGLLDASLVHPPRSLSRRDPEQRRRRRRRAQSPVRRSDPEPRGHPHHTPACRSRSRS